MRFLEVKFMHVFNNIYQISLDSSHTFSFLNASFKNNKQFYKFNLGIINSVIHYYSKPSI